MAIEIKKEEMTPRVKPLKENKSLKKSQLQVVYASGVPEGSELGINLSGSEIDSLFSFRVSKPDACSLNVIKPWRKTYNRLKNDKKVSDNTNIDISAFFKP